MISTASPSTNAPSKDSTPTRSRLRPSCSSARRAPSLMVQRRPGSRRRRRSRTCAPSSRSRARMEGRAEARLLAERLAQRAAWPAPGAITVVMPDHVAIRAAASFEAMPPLPTPERLAPATSSEFGVDGRDLLDQRRRRDRAADRRSRARRCRSTAPGATRRPDSPTSAARRSLSPKRISSSATASFSFTIGTTSSASSASSVPRACRYWPRWEKSSGASRTWPTAVLDFGEGVAPRVHQQRLADRRDRLEGRRRRSVAAAPLPTSAQPAVIAPEVTTTTCPALVAQVHDVGGDVDEHLVVDPARGVGDRGRADLRRRRYESSSLSPRSSRPWRARRSRRDARW